MIEGGGNADRCGRRSSLIQPRGILISAIMLTVACGDGQGGGQLLGPLSAANSTASVPATGATGVATAIAIQGRDANANPLETGGASVTVRVTGANDASPVVTDHGDGTYSTSYTPTAVGTDDLAITVDGTPISGSPFSSAIGPGTRAFPGALGFGAYATGGRGGAVLHVTNLNDDGAGSLRWAVEQGGARTIVFDVSGTIRLQTSLIITEGNVTLAGQTAPGDGVTLRGPGDDTALRVNAGNSIVRHVRIRRGAGGDGDAISIKARNVMIDHCSVSWAPDEDVEIWEPSDLVTIQWSIISEGFGEGGLLAGYPTAKPVRLSLHHNLFAHVRSRTPVVGSPDLILVDWRNNAVYNWNYTSEMGDENIPQSVVQLNAVSNYYKSGPSAGSTTTVSEAMMQKPSVRPADLYISGNWMNGAETGQSSFVGGFTFVTTEHGIDPAYRVPTTGALTAYTDVLDDAGASFPTRDAVDDRIVTDVVQGTGSIITSETQVGGWPELSQETRPPGYDTDRDGMPDTWENANGLDRADPSDANGDTDGDGYTNLEEFLNGLVTGSPSAPLGTRRSADGNRAP